MITRADTNTLIKMHKKGNPYAKRKVIELNTPLCIGVAVEFIKKYKLDNIELSDLINVGVVGLEKSIERFDDSKASFGTFAVYYIRVAISRYIESTDKTVRPPNISNGGTKKSVSVGREALPEMKVRYCDIQKFEKDESLKKLSKIILNDMSPRRRAVLTDYVKSRYFTDNGFSRPKPSSISKYTAASAFEHIKRIRNEIKDGKYKQIKQEVMLAL